MSTDLSLEEARETVARRASFCLDPSHTTLLIADDSVVERSVMTNCLKHLDWPARTVYAADGEEAWAMLQSIEPPIIVISDYHMPKATGLDLVNRMRDDARTLGVPIFVISSQPTAQRVQGCMEAGATGFFPKPEDAGQTLALVKTLHAFAFQHCFTAASGG